MDISKLVCQFTFCEEVIAIEWSGKKTTECEPLHPQAWLCLSQGPAESVSVLLELGFLFD